MERFTRCPGPVPRRVFLQTGATALGGLGLADIYRLKAQAGTENSETAVMLVWLPGGPPHMETYDMKPDAPLEYRGDFKPIQTNVNGIEVCELLPLHAKIADRFTLIRSIHHKFADHGGGHKRFLTGREPKEPAGFVNDAPAVGCLVAKSREKISRGVPNYIAAMDASRSGVDTYSFGAAYLGPSYTGFFVPGDPSDAKFQVPNLSLTSEMEQRLENRSALLSGLDRMRRDIDKTGSMDAMDLYHRKAMELLTSSAARKAFDLTSEDPAVRERYGHHSWGQRALLGLRLIEAGSSFVTVVMENPSKPGSTFPKNCCYNWDSHAVNAHIFDDSRFRLPIYDQAISALIEDIYRRGLDQRLLLIVTGEFGRTPRISHSVGTATGVMQPGRDHWPSAMSVLVCGGGMRTGQVIGTTDAKGEHPKDRPLSPNDLWASAYRHLGIDYHQAFNDLTGRPMPILPYGEPIVELS